MSCLSLSPSPPMFSCKGHCSSPLKLGRRCRTTVQVHGRPLRSVALEPPPESLTISTKVPSPLPRNPMGLLALQRTIWLPRRTSPSFRPLKPRRSSILAARTARLCPLVINCIYSRNLLTISYIDPKPLLRRVEPQRRRRTTLFRPCLRR